MRFEVELWQVILLFITVIGFVVTCIIKHESRITKVETSSAYICMTLEEIKKAIKESNDLLRKHIEKEV